MLNDYLEILVTSLMALIFLIVWRRLRLKKLKVYHSPISGPIEIYQKYNKELVMSNKNCHHGISIDHPSIKRSYWYALAQEAINHLKGKKTSQVLFLGLGANTSSRIVNHSLPQVHQTIVEIDPNIIQACRDFFHLDEMKNTSVIQADAYKLISKRPDFRYKFDVIVVDIFIGDPPYISTQSNQPDYIKKLLVWLKKDGKMIFNRPSNMKQDREDTQELVQFLKTKFKQVRVIEIHDPRGYQNQVISAFL